MSDAETKFTCPRCGEDLATSAVVGGVGRAAFPDALWDRAEEASTAHPPRRGDIGICVSCAAPLEHPGDGAAPRWMTYEEVLAMNKVDQWHLALIVLFVLTQRDV
jgi:hypothetical protein